jgi:hypothetical protein
MERKSKKVRVVETTVGAAIDDAFSALETLGGEMRDAYDNTPESLQQSDVGNMRDEAANVLEGLSQPDVPQKLYDIPCSYTEDRRLYQSRSRQRDEAVCMLDAARCALEEFNVGSVATGDEGEELDSDRDTLVEEVQQLIEDAEGVEFPGRNG